MRARLAGFLFTIFAETGEGIAAEVPVNGLR
jgi:hypothetical protein